MERRRSLKRKKEDDMNEHETRLSSMRARVTTEPQDETLNDKNSAVRSDKRKRFSYPGNTRGTQDLDQQQPTTITTNTIFQSRHRTKPSTGGTTDFEAHLQEVWSVRNNIHHKQHQSSGGIANAGSKTSILQPGGGIALTQADKYSRHGAIPPLENQPQRNKETATKNTIIETVTPWSVRKPNSYKYSNASPTTKQQRQHQHTNNSSAIDMTSSVRGKGRGREPARICREDFEPAITAKREPSDKVHYAKEMAKGYLRSVGGGEYTPEQHTYTKEPNSPPTADTVKIMKWKRTDSDEFDF